MTHEQLTAAVYERLTHVHPTEFTVRDFVLVALGVTDAEPENYRYAQQRMHRCLRNAAPEQLPTPNVRNSRDRYVYKMTRTNVDRMCAMMAL